jgi:hypothetical protein
MIQDHGGYPRLLHDQLLCTSILESYGGTKLETKPGCFLTGFIGTIPLRLTGLLHVIFGTTLRLTRLRHVISVTTLWFTGLLHVFNTEDTPKLSCALVILLVASSEFKHFFPGFVVTSNLLRLSSF